MARQAKQKLTDTLIKSLKAEPGKASTKYYDAGTPYPGLYIEVFQDGAKRWRYKYRNPETGKYVPMGLGVYPRVSLKEARERHAEAARLVERGINPKAARDAQKTAESGADTFAAIAQEWLDKFAPSRAASYTKSLAGRLRLHILPWIGSRPVNDIKPQELLEVARRVEAKGHIETAHRVLELAGQIFNYAIQTGRAEVNPALPLKGALPPAPTKHMAAITDPTKIGRLLLDIDRYTGHFTTICALKLSSLVFLRPGELRTLKWEHVDFERKELRLPIEHMKRRQTEKIARQGELAHTVPLARQAMTLLEELHMVTGNTPFLFPHYRKKQEKNMSNMTVLNALRSMGYDSETMSPHGFRHMASTNLNEQGYPGDFIEKQLSHKESNSIRATYNHAEYLEQRHSMMQAWADWLDSRREEARQAEAERREAVAQDFRQGR